jgi:predicted nuclease of predicted toxin-antitoxin system
VNFLVDAQLPPALARWISERGHTATHVIEHGLQAMDDPLIWQHAQEKNLVIISKDEDFVDRWLLKPEGVRVVWIRKGNCSNQVLLTWLEPIWLDVAKRLEQGEQLIELRA